MKKRSILVTTVLATAVLFSTSFASEAKAEEVTTNNAVQVAKQAMTNSGGNPDLQNFNQVKDKGQYFIIGINNKSGVGVGTYKVYKNGEVEYKSGNFGEYSTLNSKDNFTAQGISSKSYNEKEDAKQENTSVDSTKELNAYYVGHVKSDELPESGQKDILPNEALAGLSLVAGTILISQRQLRKTS
ncbi:cell surface protein [Staphylococcus pasteuri]|uniref:cell surface protein n=1 Tax=Staphylococcus pasteuri TaxID=45972 RepID=UPI001E4D630B|nr:cell surface protein [Staphylococcus pasteuri]MCD9066604.1 cell surface protein [Staphylococcus pasteuri]WAE39781.1 cell surface protein [Staphylococcus pasteuri]